MADIEHINATVQHAENSDKVSVAIDSDKVTTDAEHIKSAPSDSVAEEPPITESAFDVEEQRYRERARTTPEESFYDEDTEAEAELFRTRIENSTEGFEPEISTVNVPSTNIVPNKERRAGTAQPISDTAYGRVYTEEYNQEKASAYEDEYEKAEIENPDTSKVSTEEDETEDKASTVPDDAEIAVIIGSHPNEHVRAGAVSLLAKFRGTAGQTTKMTEQVSEEDAEEGMADTSFMSDEAGVSGLSEKISGTSLSEEDGKASTGEFPGDAVKETVESVQKVSVYIPSSNRKVRPLQLLRGESEKVGVLPFQSEKVTTGTNTGHAKDRPSRLDTLRSGSSSVADSSATDNIAEEQVEKDEEKKERRQRILKSAFASWMMPGIIIIGGLIVIILLIANWFITTISTALESGYETVMEEEGNRFDGGYDKITYLLTKYGLSEEELYRYYFKGNTVIVGGKELDKLNNDRDLRHLTRSLRIVSDPDARVGNDISSELMEAAGYWSLDLEREGMRSDPSKVIFWFGYTDMADGNYEADPSDFAKTYEEMIKEYTEMVPSLRERSSGTGFTEGIFAVDSSPRIYIVSILDPELLSDRESEEEITRIGAYNNALEELCNAHNGWCYIDIDEFMDEDIFESDGVTYSKDFYKFKLLPFLAKATGGRYTLGRSLYKDGGLYDLSPSVSLHAMIQYLYEYKNGNNVYDKFKKYAEMDRSEFKNDEVQNAFSNVWDEIYDNEASIYSYKLYADQQEFIAEEYYKHRIRTFIQSTYSVNIKGASYAFKAAVTSLGFNFAYPTGSKFEEKEESSVFKSLFDGIDWTSPEDQIIAHLYEKAKAIDPDHADRWEMEKQDCLSMFNGTLNMYAADHNSFGYINWESHLLNGGPPADLAKYTEEPAEGIKIVHLYAYTPTHDETGGALAEEYTAFALSFADAPEDYGSGRFKLPYVWGGTSLVTGADCSGFIGTILARYGLLDPAVAAQHGYSSGNFPGLGVGASADDIRVGDVICYRGHVAIYIGNGQIVHEPSANRLCGVEIGNAFAWPIVSIRRFVNAGSMYDSTDFLGDSRMVSMTTGGSIAYGMLPEARVHATWGGTITENALSDIAGVSPGAKQAFFWYGINDVGKNNKNDLEASVAAFKTAYAAAIDQYRIRNPQVSKIYLLSILGTSREEKDWISTQSQRITRYNTVLQELAREKNCTYLDITSNFQEQEKGYTGDLADDIHFTESWYREKFLPAIRPYITR